MIGLHVSFCSILLDFGEVQEIDIFSFNKLNYIILEN